MRIKSLALALAVLCVASSATAAPAQAQQTVISSEVLLGAPTPVYRWWSAGNKDWVSVPRHGMQTVDLTGYTQHPTASFYVNMIGTTDPDMVAVYRWWHPVDLDWKDVRDGEAAAETQGYGKKTFQFYAYRSPGEGRVAVVRWKHAGDHDWVTLRDNEIPDSTMRAWGYDITSKTIVAWAYPTDSLTGARGYFQLDPPQPDVVPATNPVAQGHPHTMSVLDVNPSGNPNINGGFRYLGHYGHHGCGGIRIARTNNLDAGTWNTSAAPPAFAGGMPCRWASTLVDAGQVALVATQAWGAGADISGQVSTDGLNGAQFAASRMLVKEPGKSNGNPTLFRDPVTNRIHLYWYRENTDTSPMTYEIRVKSADTFAELLASGEQNLGEVVAMSPARFAAPQVMYFGGIYYLAVETYETEPSGVNAWQTRVLTGASAQGPFYEIPAGTTVYPSGAACVFQHVVGNTLHSYYCQQGTANKDDTWTLDHIKGNLNNRT
jgi:hypothetical protein